MLWQEGDGVTGVLPSLASGKPIISDVNNAFGLMGSTAVVALLECEGSPESGRPVRVVVANCGDSRAALCRAGKAIALTEDHKPDDPVETARIEAAGGFVAAVGPCQRIDGWGLNLSRALGDFHYKARTDLPPEQQKVSAFPDLQSCEITEQDEFLLLCCDGVFELHSTQDAVDMARAGIAEGKPLQEVVENLVDACCSPDLVKTCGHGGDNVSAMIVLLGKDF
jgi:serine/threonine protein phosphatase PrpC